VTASKFNARSPFVIACGKFQPFHNEHLDYVLEAFSRFDHVVVGITNPDPHYVRVTEADPTRSSAEANLMTFFERMEMVHRALGAADIASRRFRIVPFPVNVPESWQYYIPARCCTFAITLYDDDPWLIERKEIIEKEGHKTVVMWSKPTKGIVGADIRQRIRKGEPWKHLVPASTVEVMDEFGIIERIRETQGHGGQR